MGTGASVVANVNIFPPRKYMEGRAPKKYFKLKLFPSLSKCMKLGFTEPALLKLFGVFLSLNTNESGITNATECLAYYGGRITKYVERLFVFSPTCATTLLSLMNTSDTINNTHQSSTETIMSPSSPVPSEKLIFHNNTTDDIHRIKQYGLSQYDFELWLILLWSYCTLSTSHIAQKLFEIFDVENKGVLERADVETMYRMLYDCDEADAVQIDMLPFTTSSSTSSTNINGINANTDATAAVSKAMTTTNNNSNHIDSPSISSSNTNRPKSVSQKPLSISYRHLATTNNNTNNNNTATATISKHAFVEFCCDCHDMSDKVTKKKKITKENSSSNSNNNNKSGTTAASFHLIQPALDYRNRMINWSGGMSAVWKSLIVYRQLKFKTIDKKLHSSTVNHDDISNNTFMTVEKGLECILLKIYNDGDDEGGNNNEADEKNAESDDGGNESKGTTMTNNSNHRHHNHHKTASNKRSNSYSSSSSSFEKKESTSIIDDDDNNYDEDDDSVATATAAMVEHQKSKILKLQNNLFNNDIKRCQHEAEDAKYYLDECMTEYTNTDHTIESVWSSHEMRVKVYTLLDQYQIKNEAYYVLLDEREQLFAKGSVQDQERRYMDYIETTEDGRYIRLLYTLKFCLEHLLLNDNISGSSKKAITNTSIKSSASVINNNNNNNATAIIASAVVESNTTNHQANNTDYDNHSGIHSSIASITSTISAATSTANSVNKLKQKLQQHVKKTKRELELNAALFVVNKSLAEYDTLENEMMKDTLQLIRSNQLPTRPTLQLALSRSTSESNLNHLNHVLNESLSSSATATAGISNKSSMSKSRNNNNNKSGAVAARKSIKFHDNNDGTSAPILDKQSSLRSLFSSSSSNGGNSISNLFAITTAASVNSKNKSTKTNNSTTASNSKAVARAMAALTKGVGAIEVSPSSHSTFNTSNLLTMIIGGGGGGNNSSMISRPQSRASGFIMNSTTTTTAAAAIMSGKASLSLSRPQSRATTANRRGSSFKGDESVNFGDGGNSNKSMSAIMTHSSKLQYKLQRLREINSGEKELTVCNKYGSAQELDDAEIQADDYLSVLYQTQHEERTHQEIIARKQGRLLMYQELSIDWMVRYGAKESRWERVRDTKRDVFVMMNIDTMAVLPKHATVICQQCDAVLESFMNTCKRCDYKNITSVASAAVRDGNNNLIK